MIGAPPTNVSTDVFDDGGQLYTIEAETYDVMNDTYFECDDLFKTVDGSNSIYFSCDGNAADYVGLNHTIQKGVYFWEGGDKFRVDWKITNTSAAPLTLSAKVRNNFGSNGTDSHYQFGNSTAATSQQWGDSDDDTTAIQNFEARWAAHYEEEDAPIGFAWGADAATNTGVVSDYNDDDLDIVYENLTIPANDFIYIAVYYAWPAATMVAANYTNSSTQPFSFVQEAATEIAAMQASPTSEMTALIDDPARVINWRFVQASAPAPAPYTGPVLASFSSRTLDVCTPKSITITGVRLSGVTAASVQGKSVTVLENTATKLVLAFPAGLTPGNNVDLVINSSSGTLTHQDAFDIPADTCIQSETASSWTKNLNNGSVKMYAKNIVGTGKVQFFLNSEEVAWVRAVDQTDAKLREANGFYYLVRTVLLVKGQKNVLETYVDGVRTTRSAYTY